MPLQFFCESRKNHLEQGRTNIVIAQCAFSSYKGTLRKLLEQHLDDISFEKAEKSYSMGTERTFGGKIILRQQTDGDKIKENVFRIKRYLGSLIRYCDFVLELQNMPLWHISVDMQKRAVLIQRH